MSEPVQHIQIHLADFETSELMSLLTAGTSDGIMVVETWAVFNDPARVQQLVDSGQLHPELQGKFNEPLWQSPTAGAAKRFMLWTNTQRAENTDTLTKLGYAILRKQIEVRQPWATVSDEELELIDEGRRANG